MTNNRIRLIIVEDHHLTMRGLEEVLSNDPELEVVGKAYDSDNGFELAKKVQPDLVLLDLHLPGSTGPKTTVELFCAQPSTRVIVFTAETGAAFVQAVLKAGAAAYLLKSETPERVVHLIKKTMQSRAQIVSPQLAAEQTAFTKVEQHVLMLLAQGMKYNEIAEQRSTSPATIRRQCEMLQEKLNLNSREELIAWAANNGFAKLDTSIE